MKWFSLSQIFCYSDEHFKRKDIFNPLSLTKSEDGAAERHDELSVLEHLGLGLELHGPHHQDDHAGHEEGHAEVEQGQSPAETLVAVTENRWMNENLMSASCFVKGLIIPVDKLIKSDNEG